MNDVQDKLNYSAQTLGLLALTTLFLILILSIVSQKQVEYYYLCDGMDGLSICAYSEWTEDDTISLNGMTFEEAIDHVERLNNTLPIRGEE